MPSLEKEENLFWNIQSVIPISTMWIKSKRKADKITLEISELDIKLSSLRQGDLIVQLEEKKNLLEQKRDGLINELEVKKHDRTTIKEFKGQGDSFQAQLTKIRVEIAKIDTEILQIKKEITEHTLQAKDTLFEVKKLLDQKAEKEKMITALKQNLKANNQLYNSILNSFATALTKKRVAI
jgi:chromosome segregation ATPase